MEKSSSPSIESKSETESKSKNQSKSSNQSPNQNPSQNQSSQRSVSVTRKAGLMFLGTFASRILGFVRDMVLAALFPRVVTDAWLAAFRIPNFFRRLLGENTLAASFTPLFLETKTKQGAEAAKALHHSIFTLLFYFLLVLSLGGFLQSEKILTLFLSDTGFVEIPEKLNMAQSMLKIMFGFVFFITLFAYFMALLNALGHFSFPALAPTLFNVSLIIFALLPESLSGTGTGGTGGTGTVFAFRGQALAWGVLIGALLQCLLLIHPLWRKGYLPRLQWNIQNIQWKPSLQVLTRMVPVLLGGGIVQIMTLANLYFASALKEGTLSWIYWADRLMELPLSLISVSLSSSLLPALALYRSQDKKKEMTSLCKEILSLNYFLCIPAAFAFFYMGTPIVKWIFFRGAFGEEDLLQVSMVLQVYAFTLIATSGSRILSTLFYAEKRLWTATLLGVFSLILHILLVPWCISRWGFLGIPISSCVSAFVNWGGFLFFFHRYISPFSWITFGGRLGLFVLLSLPLILLFRLHEPLTALLSPLPASQTLSLLTIVAGSLFLYLFLAQKCRLKEAILLFSILKSKTKLKPPKEK